MTDLIPGLSLGVAVIFVIAFVTNSVWTGKSWVRPLPLPMTEKTDD